MGDINLFEVMKEYWHIVLVAAFLFILAIDFLLRFVWQSAKLNRELRRALAALRDVRSKAKGDVVELGEIGSQAMASRSLVHLWSEYSKTLHPQREEDPSGQSRIVRWRATALAETFFTEQAIVDSRLKTEFFKHLPGVLTGLGIIGTFLGLIKGRVNFDVSLDPTKAQDQLRSLVNSVGHAFFVSASAIGMAMVFTWIEKSLVTARYRQVEELRELIDSLFRGGAGEEYLERLAIASETSATQALQIKDSLVTELRELLTNLTTQQIAAQAQNTGQMSADKRTRRRSGVRDCRHGICAKAFIGSCEAWWHHHAAWETSAARSCKYSIRFTDGRQDDTSLQLGWSKSGRRYSTLRVGISAGKACA